MKSARQLNLTQYGGLYKRISNCPLDTCWYCGAGRECLDHCPPIAVMPLLNIKKFREDKHEFLLIPSCGLCNSLLGCEYLYNPNERLSWLLENYSKLLNKCYFGWTKEETDTMGYSMQLHISTNIATSEIYQNKIQGIYQRILEIKDYKNTGFCDVAILKTTAIKTKPPTKKQLERKQSIEREKLRKQHAKETYNSRLRQIRKECWGEG